MPKVAYKKLIDDLTSTTEALLKQCIKNMKGVESIINILEELNNKSMSAESPCSQKNPLSHTRPELASSDKALSPNDDLRRQDDIFIQDEKIIMERRVELHKELGTYIEPLLPKEPLLPLVFNTGSIIDPLIDTRTEVNTPMITPLFKLNKREKEALYRDIFNKASNYIKNILGIATTDETFDLQVSNEADRLLKVWIEINKAK